MQPLATYHELRYDGKREFELYPEKVCVRNFSPLGKLVSSAEVPLAPLTPEREHVVFRHPLFRQGLIFASFGVLVSALSLISPRSALAWGVLAIGLVLLALGFALCVVTRRPVEAFRFYTDARIIGLDVARSRKDGDHFEPFVQTLTDHIRQARAATSPK